MAGKKCWEIAHGTDCPIQECPLLRIKKSLGREYMELKIGRHWFVVYIDPLIDSKGSINGYVHIVSNITQRKQMEEDLRQTTAKFQSIFDQSSVGAVIVNLEKRILSCNLAFCRFLGYTEQELIGKTIADITYPEDVDVGMRELKLILDGELESIKVQKRYFRKDKTIV